MDGSGYRYLADWIITLNTQNPQIAARMLAPLTRWKRYTEARQVMMRGELERIMAVETLSPDVYEVVSKSLV
jgi:aminopeptidase N